MDPCYGGSMVSSTTRTPEQRRDALLERLQQLPNLMRGTVWERPGKMRALGLGQAISQQRTRARTGTPTRRASSTETPKGAW